MDDALHRQLAYTWSDAPVLLLPRVASSAVKIDKINVIGERQRFGASVLAAGLSVVHSDADALWRADPTPLLSDGDVVASRIWGKPKSVVSAWGAGMCTGFYFVRSSSAAVELAREIQSRVAAKAAAHSSWQTSDQFYLNVVLHERGVVWRGGKRMAGLDDFNGRMHSLSRHVGVAGGANRSRRLRLTMLPHALVPRACLIVKASDAATRAGRNKLALWKSVLTTATVLHCFPPGGDPAPGEKRNIMMGHPRHTAAEERAHGRRRSGCCGMTGRASREGRRSSAGSPRSTTAPRARSCRRRRRCRARMCGKCWRSGRRAVGLLGRDFIRHRHTNRLSSAARRRAFFT